MLVKIYVLLTTCWPMSVFCCLVWASTSTQPRGIALLGRPILSSVSRITFHEHLAFLQTFILGGQIKGGEQRLYLIYPEGNFIEVSEENPFFQIGETKYGRPILVRGFYPEMTFEEAIKLLMVSFDSTIKANLSVGLPLDIYTYEKDSFIARPTIKIKNDDAYFNMISNEWGKALKESLATLPSFKFKK